MLTGYGDVPTAVDALKHGAIEFLEKPFQSDLLLSRIGEALAQDAQRHQQRKEYRAVRQRLRRLTPRQCEVLGLVVQGLSSKEIAKRLFVTSRTVEAHRQAIMKKMEARSVAELVRTVVGIFPLPERVPNACPQPGSKRLPNCAFGLCVREPSSPMNAVWEHAWADSIRIPLIISDT